MITLSARVQIVLGITLATLMAATRGRHFGALEYVPTASWAVFFLAGIYLCSRWIYTAFLAEAALLDFAAITWGGVGSFCVSPAYGFLLPAYGMLWEPAGSSRRAWHSSRHVSLFYTGIGCVVHAFFSLAGALTAQRHRSTTSV
ncbi:hypothetical protein [Candidatus Nitrospira nitrificans]|uniref:Uncharacterized protein n=1 Tax=Candidatus Nitrospira nitrificans TaxID=1742973 RepID=A0A0S4LND4_9BACT|nr:hypothetical protein [Candidatus Nitrospira nitrificans]CUS39036.1 membrane hypothetical protein [Candidatus Nitrospira nitrificans]